MNGKKHYFYIAGIVLLIMVIIFLGWQNMELKKSQNLLLNQIQQAGASKDGRVTDPYIIGPAKNTITKNAHDIQECYNAFIDRNPAKTDGLITVDWQIDTKGKTIKPEIVSSELPDQELTACITGKIANWNFPPPDIDKYVSHKFTFKKQ